MIGVDQKTRALMRASAQAYMLDVCGLCTRTNTITDGVTKPTYSVAVSTSCQWISDESGTEFSDGTLRTVSEARATVLFPIGTTISAKDMLTFDGRKWNVEFVSPSDELVPHMTVKVREIR
jgi:hypothetical protein